jgi:hypothetical protein
MRQCGAEPQKARAAFVHPVTRGRELTMIELILKDRGRILSFDGRVIEAFRPNQVEAIRRHVSHVEVAEISVDKKQQYSLRIRMVGGQGFSYSSLPPEVIEQAQKLVAEVERVRASL